MRRKPPSDPECRRPTEADDYWREKVAAPRPGAVAAAILVAAAALLLM